MEKCLSEQTIFKATLTLEDILREVHKDPFKYFTEYPVSEVRIKCLEEMNEFEDLYTWHADWAEKCIIDLLKQRDVLGEKLVSWYLFTVKNEAGVIRSLEFVINLKNDRSFYWPIEKSSKIVASKLVKLLNNEINPKIHFYHSVLSLKDFLNELLNRLEISQSSDGYLNCAWHCADRALRIIIAAQDFSFLPKIENLILLHTRKIIWPWRFDSPYTVDMNVAMLKATKRLLIKAKRESLHSSEN